MPLFEKIWPHVRTDKTIQDNSWMDTVEQMLNYISSVISGGVGKIISINGDTTPAQHLIAGANVTIVDGGGGNHTISSTGGGGSTSDIFNEPVALIGAVGTLAHTPAAAITVRIYLNGVRQNQGLANDYTVSGSTITFTFTPTGGSIVLADYQVVAVPASVFNEVVAFAGTTGNTAFTPIIIPTITLCLYRNGIRQQPGIGNDFTLSGTTITLSLAAGGGDVFLADYQH